MHLIDLHVHSTASDGTYTPSQVVDYAIKKGLKAIALTDHDTIDGLKEATQAAAGTLLELVPGIEFSTEYQGKDVHIVGLDIRWDKPGFSDSLAAFQDSRDERNLEMARRLRDLCGFDITLEELTEHFPGAVLTRAHYGQLMMEKGYVKTVSEAFTRYLGDSCPCFVPRKRISPLQAIELILEADGIPILAHPVLYRMSESQLETLVSGLKKHGLVGLEAIYSTYMGMDESNMRRLARKYDLKISGGSDFHGTIKPHIDLGTGKGNLKIPYDILLQLRRN